MSVSIFGDAGADAVALARDWAERNLGTSDVLSMQPGGVAVMAPRAQRRSAQRRIANELEADARTRFGKPAAQRMRRELTALAATLAILAFAGVAADQAQAAITYSGAGTTSLTVNSDAADPIDVTCNANSVEINAVPTAPVTACNTLASLTLNGGPGNNVFTVNGVTDALFPALAAAGVIMNGGSGNDAFNGDATDMKQRANGDAGVDGFFSGSDADTLNGGEDADGNLWGGAGNDVIDGGNGSDGAGGTRLDGMTGNDTVSGGSGDDNLFENDVVGAVNRQDGGEGNDTLNNGGGAAFNQTGGPGADDLLGDAVADTMDGGDGNDRLRGFGGNDTMTGGPGADTLDNDAGGAMGDDVLSGGDGNDLLGTDNGATLGKDRPSGGCGDDVFRFQDNDPAGAVDTIAAAAGEALSKDTVPPNPAADVTVADTCAGATTAPPAGSGGSTTVVTVPGPTTTTPGSSTGGGGTPGSTQGFSRAFLTNTVFSVAGEPTPEVIASQAAKGTTIVYTLQKNSKVTIDIARRIDGYRGVSNRGSCQTRSASGLRRALGRRLSRRVRGAERRRRINTGIRARRCTKARHEGSLQRNGVAGQNRVPFSGRIGSRALRPGKYQAVLRGTDSDGQTLSNVRLFFRIVR